MSNPENRVNNVSDDEDEKVAELTPVELPEEEWAINLNPMLFRDNPPICIKCGNWWVQTGYRKTSCKFIIQKKKDAKDS